MDKLKQKIEKSNRALGVFHAGLEKLVLDACEFRETCDFRLYDRLSKALQFLGEAQKFLRKADHELWMSTQALEGK